MAAFYTVADARHFLGAVALLNSLRLVGHDDPFFVLDYGLTEAQRRAVRGAVTLVDAPAGRAATLVKWAAPLAHPADAMVVVDADVIVVRSLESLLADARDGRVVAFADEHPTRFHPAWAELVGVAELSRRTYLNAGFLALPADAVPVLERVRDAQNSIDVARSRPFGGGSPDDPFFYPDQDVWNAVLAAFVPAEGMTVLEHRLAPFPPFAGLRLVDERRLTCATSNGAPPFLLHHIMAKPWLRLTRPTVYSRLLPRLLAADDLAVRVPDELLPARYRPGLRGRCLRPVAAAAGLAGAQRGRLGLRRWLAQRFAG